jgi:hypothetical protein
MKIKPSAVVLNLAIILILAITAMFSYGAAMVEYTVLNMYVIGWLFSLLDANKKDDYEYHIWTFITIVAWCVIVVGIFVFAVVKIGEFMKLIGEKIDNKFIK